PDAPVQPVDPREVLGDHLARGDPLLPYGGGDLDGGAAGPTGQRRLLGGRLSRASRAGCCTGRTGRTRAAGQPDVLVSTQGELCPGPCPRVETRSGPCRAAVRSS